MIYDALMLALAKNEIKDDVVLENNITLEYMEKKYIENKMIFNGKKQSKNDILQRADFFDKIIQDILEGKMYE